MVFKRFRFLLVFRIVLLAMSLLLFVWLIYATHFYISTAFVGLAVIVQVVLLIRFVDRTNDRLTRFFSAIRYADFTQVFRSESNDPSFLKLSDELNEVMKAFRDLRREREEKELFLQTIVQHIGIGLIVYDADGKIELSNTAIKRLSKSTVLQHLSEFKGPFETLGKSLFDLKGGEPGLIKIADGGELLQLAVSVTECILRDRHIRIATVQNIGKELNEKELEAWHMLTRVLAHEIMNSMTPIISLASSASDVLGNIEVAKNAEESLDDARKAVGTIERRGEGLIRFVETYRSLTRIPRPAFKVFPVQELFSGVLQLMSERLERAGIKVQVIIDPEDLKLTADPNLLEQVMINLVINSIEALDQRPDPLIKLSAFYDENSRIIIKTEDNGKGILKDVQKEIFIPFFTTKRSGSGIGLSLSKQILSLHGSSINVESEPGNYTIFTIRF